MDYAPTRGRNTRKLETDKLVEFKVPVRAGQLVELVARITREGRTSLTVAVEMYVEELLSRNRQLATTGSFVFVAIDADGKATPIRDE